MYRHWYATQRARDHAFDNLRNKSTILKQYGFDPRIRKVNRQ